VAKPGVVLWNAKEELRRASSSTKPKGLGLDGNEEDDGVVVRGVMGATSVLPITQRQGQGLVTNIRISPKHALGAVASI